MELNFGHSPAQLHFWRNLVTPLLKSGGTPFYLFSIEPIEEAIAELQHTFDGLPLRHWLSFKTQPLRPLVQWWCKNGRGVEVVSEFEFLAALNEGFVPENILINGPAKHRWLGKYRIKNLSVNFDSEQELTALLPSAKRLNWRVGIRINTDEEFDPETPQIKTQFGFLPDDAVRALKKLQRAQVRLEMTHFHLRTNISSPSVYERALTEVATVCRDAKFAPKFVNCGGGFPPQHVLTRDGKPVAVEFKLSNMRKVYEAVLKNFPNAEEIWLENGRWLSARSGVLVVKILDVKPRPNMRNLICDGGRTMNAMLSTWEQHALFSIPPRNGKSVPTTVNGPTCMAFDQLARRPLPASLRVGDHLVWLEAGAYHLGWETRFSHGLAAVYWHHGKKTRLIRKQQDFENWWQQWI